MGNGTTARRRLVALIAIVVIVVAAVIFLVAGGDEEADPAAEAQAAAESFVGSLGAGDFDAACDDLSQELRAQLGGEECPEQIGIVAGEGEIEIEITDVRVSGPKAVAETEVRREGAGTQESSLELVDHEGSWEIAGLGD
jgi:hypothetical protein